ncbi:MAG: SpaA isopeptide-forming pilin-related protein [Actinomycetaceae bacterium]|nr:SpaA isopeptide-forming pilin-related protein [Actinomycetaceae bacterium]MDY5853972.1 SpaA isopeptide-forming pilin-related protein [Arcanobacterium sp.]
MDKRNSMRFVAAVMLACALMFGAAVPAAVAEPVQLDTPSDLLLLTSTGEILGYDDEGNLIPALPYLPAISQSARAKTKPVNTTYYPDFEYGRWDHGSNNADTRNWYQIQGFEYNALGSGPDGSYYAMLRVSNDTLRTNYRGAYQVYKLEPGATSWTTYGVPFYLASDTVPPEQSGRSQAVPMGGVNPIDGKYYFGSVVMNDQGQTNFHVYRMDQNGPVYLGYYPLDAVQNPDGNTMNTNGGDIAFTDDGSIVVSSAVNYIDSRDGMSFNYVRMSIVRADDLQAGTGGQLAGFNLPLIELATKGAYNQGAQGYDLIQQTTGFAVLSDGTLITSNHISDSGTYILAEGDNWDSSQVFGKVLGGIVNEVPTGTISTAPALCLNQDPAVAGIWNNLTAKPGKPQNVDGPSSVCRYKLYNTQILDMAGAMTWFPSVDLRKNVIERINSDDQFKLSISFDNGALLNEETTTGSATGEQAVYAGPVPVAAGARLKVSETITTSTDLRTYKPSLKCVDGNGNSVASLTTEQLTIDAKSASAVLTVPEATGAGVDLSCTFTNGVNGYDLELTKVDGKDNKPLAGAQLKLWKDVNENGKLDLGTDKLVTSESVPANTQGVVSTPADGIVTWKSLADGHYLVQEVAAPEGYKTLTEAKAVALNGANAEITLENTELLGSIVFEKRASVDGTAGDGTAGELLSGSQWELTYPEEGSVPGVSMTFTDCIVESGCAGTLDKDPRPGVFKVVDLPLGKYVLKETKAPQGYKLSANASREIIINSDKPYTLTNDDAILNEPMRGTIIFEKRAKTDGEPATGSASELGSLLSGSEWKLTYPQNSGKQPATITDCVAGAQAGADACAGTGDADPTPGVVKLIDLPLGTYTLQETKAPSGYILDSSVRFITLDSEEPYALTGARAILNEQRIGPTLPLTGGVGRDFFLIAGGGTLLAALTVSLIMLGRRRTQKLS